MNIKNKLFIVFLLFLILLSSFTNVYAYYIENTLSFPEDFTLLDLESASSAIYNMLYSFSEYQDNYEYVVIARSVGNVDYFNDFSVLFFTCVNSNKKCLYSESGIHPYTDNPNVKNWFKINTSNINIVCSYTINANDYNNLSYTRSTNAFDIVSTTCEMYPRLYYIHSTVNIYTDNTFTNYFVKVYDDVEDNSSWFSRILRGISNIFNAIGNLASNIANAIGNVFTVFFENIGSLLNDIVEFMGNTWDFLLELPGNIINGIINGIKNLFIPEDGFFDNCVNGIKENLATKIPYETYLEVFGTLSDGSYYDGQKDLNIDINNYKISEDLFLSMNDFIDFNDITKYKNTWHMWVRGFIFILLLIYNMNEFVKLLRGYNVAANVAAYNYKHGGGK